MVMMKPITELREQMDRLFHDMEEFQLPGLGEFRPLREKSARTWVPSVDLVETEKDYELKVEVPGIKPENIEVEVLDDAVVIRGQSREEKTEEQKGVYRRECHIGSLYRRIPLPGTVKSSDAKAELAHGILDLKLPKAQAEKGKRIQVQSR